MRRFKDRRAYKSNFKTIVTLLEIKRIFEDITTTTQRAATKQVYSKNNFPTDKKIFRISE